MGRQETPMRGSKPILVGVDEGGGVGGAGEGACGDWEARTGETAAKGLWRGGYVEVDEAAVELGEGGAVLPAQAGVDGEVGADAPVVGDEGVVDGLAEVLVGVAEGDGAGVGHAQEEVGEV